MAILPKVPDKLRDRVERDDNGCWLWTRACFPVGYGAIRIEGKTHYAHRLAWVAANGQIPDGLSVLHKCDVRKCCNPDHLFLGTQRENLQDMGRKGRSPRGERHYNVKLTDAQVRTIRERMSAGASSRELAREYNVGDRHIRDIAARKKRAHVT